MAEKYIFASDFLFSSPNTSITYFVQNERFELILAKGFDILEMLK